MPWIEVSEEEYVQYRQDEVLAGILAAHESGDEPALEALWKEWVPSTRILGLAKRFLGADWIRARGIDTREADKEHGAGWLDAPTGEERLAGDPVLPRAVELDRTHERRATRKMLMYRADPAVARQLKMMAVEEDTTVQALFDEAINDLLSKHGGSKGGPGARLPSSATSADMASWHRRGA